MTYWQATVLVIAAMFTGVAANLFAVGFIMREIRLWREDAKKP